MFMLILSCIFSHSPVAIVQSDAAAIDAVYIPQGYTGFIVAAPFDQQVF